MDRGSHFDDLVTHAGQRRKLGGGGGADDLPIFHLERSQCPLKFDFVTKFIQ